MRRLILLVTLGLGVLSLCAWKPLSTLMTIAVREALEHIEKNMPIKISVKRITGSPLSDLVAEEVLIRDRESGALLISIGRLTTDIQLKALKEKRANFHTLILEKMVVHATREADGHWVLPVTEPSSDKKGWPVTIEDLQIRDSSITLVNRASKSSQNMTFNAIQVNASLNPQKLTLKDFQAALKNGRLTGKGEFQTDTKALRMSGQFISFPLHTLANAFATLPDDLELPFSGDWETRSKSGDWQASVKGKLGKSDISLKANLQGRDFKPEHWRGVLQATSTLVSSTTTLAHAHIVFQQGSALVKAKGSWQSHQADIEGTAILQPLSFNGNYHLHISTLPQMSAPEIAEGKITLHDNLLKTTADLKGFLTGRLTLTGNLKPKDKTIDLTLTSVTYRGWSFKSLKMQTTLRPESLHIKEGDMVGNDSRETLIFKGTIPFPNKTKPNPIPFDFHAAMQTWDPAMLKAFLPDVRIRSGGSMDANLELTGPWAKTELKGWMKTRIPRMAMNTIGLRLQDIAVDFDFSNKLIRITKGEAKTRKGSIQLAGQSEWPKLDFTLKAKQLRLSKRKLFEATADTDLKIQGEVLKPDILGEIHLLSGTYNKTKPKKDTAKTDEEEEDDEITSGPPQPSFMDRVRMDIRAYWERRVWYREELTKIETKADLNIKKERELPLSLIGSITLLRGAYSFYGRDFVIDHGELQFSNPVEINPSLNVEAVYRTGGTQVFIVVTGTAKTPALAMRSNPPLSNQDILSVLIFGSPLDTLRTSNESDSDRLAQAAGSVLGGYLTQGLRKAGLDYLGLDVFRVERAEQGSSRLTVGRYIGSNLFVSVGHGTGEKSKSVLHGEYYLNDRWTVIGETGSANTNFMDLQFRYPINQPKPTK